MALSSPKVNRIIVIYADNTGCYNGRYISKDRVDAIRRMFEIPEKRWDDLHIPIERGTITVFATHVIASEAAKQHVSIHHVRRDLEQGREVPRQEEMFDMPK